MKKDRPVLLPLRRRTLSAPVLLNLCFYALIFSVETASATSPANDITSCVANRLAISNWAFKPPVIPKVPKVKNTGWVRNPIDAFILAKLESIGLKPPALADKRTLLRRIYLDLIGLPPTPAEQDAFLKDSAPNSYEKLVDKLLARPEYGERWARHWLDVARYAESNGYERDGNKPNAWRYRDYVINALNADKPYDRFVVEQIAGDELDNSNAETQTATTFLRLGTWDDEPAEPMVDRYDQLDDVLGTTCATFMAQTIRCARCHDHKFEPFSQRDYYQLLSVFSPLKRPQKERDDLDVPVGTAETMKTYREAHAKCDPLAEPIQSQIALTQQTIVVRALDAKKELMGPQLAAAIRAAPAARDANQKDLVRRNQAEIERIAQKDCTAQERKSLGELVSKLKEIERDLPPEPPHAYIWYEDARGYPPTHVLVRGDPAHEGEEVHTAVPAILSATPTGEPTPHATSTGRRLWFANWLVRPENPLTARVIVNRIWQHHFGTGIVSTPNDFGTMGQRPTHPELLDWLAVKFQERENGRTEERENRADDISPSPVLPLSRSLKRWSLKSLHRLIVTSNVYRASSVASPEALKLDPDNKLLSRWPMRRLEAEAVRDSMLSVSGQLNPERGGPSVYPPLPKEVTEGQSVPGQNWFTSDERQASRRSIYVFVKRALAVPELDLLDSPDTTSSCEARPVSTIAPQALTFMNGEFARKQAHYMASRLRSNAGSDPRKQVDLAFKIALCRAPTAAEMRDGVNFVTHRGLLESYCLVILNANEFAYTN